MPTWGEVLQRFNETNDYDGIRREYLLQYSDYVQRDVIVYASGWLDNPFVDPFSVAVGDEDLTGLMQAMNGLKGPNLDLFLHSPGGSIAAAEAFVHYLRSKFAHIRAIVPQYALSAATMIACSCDSIVMGKHSFLSPTDPQIPVQTPLGHRQVAAHAIQQQFEMACKGCQSGENLSAWVPILEQFGPDMLAYSKNLIQLSETLVSEWLEAHMLRLDESSSQPNATAKAAAQSAAASLCGDANKAHDRRFPREKVEGLGLRVVRLEDDQELQDYALTVFHATIHTMSRRAVTKLIENHIGGCYVRLSPVSFAAIPQQQGPPPAN